MYTAQNRIDLALLTASVFLLLVVLVYLVNITRYQRLRRQRYTEGLEKELAAVEEDRARMADELHDGLGSTLAAIRVRLQAVSPAGSAEGELLRQAEASLDLALKTLRKMPGRHAPQFLLQRGLQDALDEYLDQLSASAGFTLDKQLALPVLPAGASLHIYRMVQEILHNTEKHAQATKVSVSAAVIGRAVCLEIKDNGHGFDRRRSVTKNPGLGIRSIRMRADALGAKVSLDTAPGKGTAYSIKIPIAHEHTGNKAAGSR